MRLNEYQKEQIHDVLSEVFGPSAEILLFGSRVDDDKKGGDIDLFVDAEFSPTELYAKKLEALGKLQRRLGERKIDLVVHSLFDAVLPLIAREAKLNGVRI